MSTVNGGCTNNGKRKLHQKHNLHIKKVGSDKENPSSSMEEAKYRKPLYIYSDVDFIRKGKIVFSHLDTAFCDHHVHQGKRNKTQEKT